MRIIVFGAGAIGSIIGSYLHRSGRETILVCSSAHTEAISRNGLKIDGVLGELVIKVPVVDSIDDIEFRGSDIIFLTMKAFDTAPAIKSIGDRAADLLAVCFQNGVRNEAIAAEKFKQIYGGIVLFGAKYLEPGKITHVSENHLGIGLYPDGLDQTVDNLSEILTRAGFSVTPYSDILAVKWSKLIRNLNNALFGITGLSVFEGIKYESVRFLMADIIEEASNIIQAEGIEIVPLSGQQPPEKMIESLRKPGDRDHEIPQDEKKKLRPSTWQDLYLKRGKTEVEYFNGEIVRLGQKHNIPTPFNFSMVRIVNQMAAEGKKPGAYTITQIRDMLT